MKVLIIDPMHTTIVPLLEQVGLSADYRPDIRPQEVADIVHAYEGLILRSKMKVDIPFLEKAARLKFIARAGAGVDQIDGAYLQKRGIKLFNAPEGNRDAVGEHTLGMILCLFNKIHLAHQEVQQKQWRREANRGIELKGKTVGIIGYGNMGKATARRLLGFGCEVLAFDLRSVRSNEDARLTSMDEIWEKADVVCYHIPLNDYNRYLVDEEYLMKFRKNIFFVNLARGEIVTLKVLRKALEKGKILGVALDVLENEKLETLTPEQAEAFAYLAKDPRVLFTPHVGGWTFESYERINEVLVAKISECYNLG